MGDNWVIGYYSIPGGNLVFSDPRDVGDGLTFESLRAEFRTIARESQFKFYVYLVDCSVAPLTAREGFLAENDWQNRLDYEDWKRSRRDVAAVKRRRREALLAGEGI